MTKHERGTKSPIRKAGGLRRVCLALVVLLIASVLLIGAAGAESADAPKGDVSRGMYSDSNNRIQCAVMNANPTASVVLELYSGTTKIATTTLTNTQYLSNAATELTVSFCITGTSSSWETVWEPGHPISNAKPNKVVLYIDGEIVAENTVTLHKNGFDQVGEEADWASDIQGVKTAPVVGNGFVTNENGHVTVWGDAQADPETSLSIDLYSGETKIATTVLNDVEGIYADTTSDLTWNFDVLGECTDAYWTTTWEEGYPRNDAQPDKVVMYIDGIDAYTSKGDVEMNRPDNLNPVVWSELFVAEVNGKIYGSIQAAIDKAGAGDTVKLLIDTSETGINVAAEDKITLDLNGKTLTGDIYSEGILTVKNGAIVNNNFVSCIESNGASASLTVEAVTATSTRHALRIEGGEATITSGTYTTLSKGDSVDRQSTHAVNAGGNEGTTTVTINGGDFIGIGKSASVTTADSGAAIMAQAGATVTVNGGSFSGGQNDLLEIYKDTDGKIVLRGGTSYDQDPSAYVDGGYQVFENDDSTWRVNKVWTITWNNADGTQLAQNTVEAGITPAYTGDEPTKTRVGYTSTFAGWSPDIAAAAEDMTYTATFDEVPNQYSITYNLNGGTNPDDAPATHTYDTATTLPTPVKESNVFKGWYTQSDLSGEPVTVLGAQDYTADITLYAKWEYYERYLVTFNANGGTVTPESGYTDQTKKLSVSLPTPAYSGYTFLGWFTAENGGEQVTANTVYTQDATIYAHWEKKEEPKSDKPTGSSTWNSAPYDFSIYTITVGNGIAYFPTEAAPISGISVSGEYSGEATLSTYSPVNQPAGKDVYGIVDLSLSPALTAGQTAAIHFQIPLSVLEGKGVQAGDAALYHFGENGWVKLETTYTIKDGIVYYEAETTSCSPFAVVFEAGSSAPNGEEPTQPTATETQTPGFGVLAVLAGLGAVAVLRRK